MVCLVASAPAGAATLTGGANLVFTAAPGIPNDFGVFGDPVTPATIVISTDDDRVVYSGASPLPTNCSDADQNSNQSPAATILCTGVSALRANLGDLADNGSTTGTTSGVTLAGEAGDDNLSAGTGAQTLDGGGGSDVISGAAGADSILGGAGGDTISGGADGDTIDGGDDDDNITGGPGDDLIDGGTGQDAISGNEAADVIRGGAGNDALVGNDGTDTLDGDDGDDQIAGGAGVDGANGGAGNDILDDSDTLSTDVLIGGTGADLLSVVLGVSGDVYDGGSGIDSVFVQAPGDPPPPIFVNLSEGVLGSATDSDTVVAVEDVTNAIGFGFFTVADVPNPNPTTVIGTSGVNAILTGAGADAINPGANNDQVAAGRGDDTIDLRDGFADRVICGGGADTVQADTLDVVADDCETVTKTDQGNANDVPDVPEDKAPAVAFTAPSPSAVLSTTAPNVLTATATDDRGIVQVIFSTGERTICVDTTAPYSCEYRPTSADVGRDTLIAVAVDSAQQTASAVRVVSVPRFKAISLTSVTSPKRDKKAPFTFTTKGRLALPAGVLRAAGCKGTVDVSFKAGKKTVSSRRVALKGDCSYSSRVTFRLPNRLNPKTLRVVVVFSGNVVMDPTNARIQSVRPR